jgi:hypothetical protein
MRNLESIVNRGDLLGQKNPAMEGMYVPTADGEVMPVWKDGCAVISLYNALRIHDYEKSFDEFTSELSANECLERGGINWKAFNRLSTDLKFTWMQDAEIARCDQVDIDRLGDWVDSGSVAVVKVQSMYGIERRHFMMALGVENDNVTCLESSDVSGVPTLRTVRREEVLGVRYLARTNDGVQR